MSLFQDNKEEGYTLKELSDHLLTAVSAGEGDRKIYIGPTGGEEGNTPIAVSVVGIECNKEVDGGENDIYWLYPGDGNEWQ